VVIAEQLLPEHQPGYAMEAHRMLMNQRERLQRMIKAAEEWGSVRFHTPVTVSNVPAPVCCDDGSLQTTVELQSTERRPQRARCLVTLEPDGTLSCFDPDTILDAIAE
jgi:hypothetical protein